MLTRNIDLSVGSIVGLVAYGMGTLLGERPDLNPAVIVGAGCIAHGRGAWAPSTA